ncbi:MAG: universal stress protein [Bacteroidota bacterium]
MSKILVPVDFTMACHNAYTYGLQLAENFNLGIQLVHYYSGSMDPNGSFYVAGDGTVQGSLQNRLEQFAQSATPEGEFPPISIPDGVQVDCEVGSALSFAQRINKRAEQDDIEFVVMATRTGNAVLEKWLGSTSATVSESCKRPIFLVPPTVRYEEIKNIVIANHHETAEDDPLEQIELLSAYTRAKLHFVNVVTANNRKGPQFIPYELMEELAEENSYWPHRYDIVSVKEKTVSGGLIKYAEQVEADLIVVVNQVRSYWKSLLYRGTTQAMTFTTDRPLLILHTEDD